MKRYPLKFLDHEQKHEVKWINNPSKDWISKWQSGGQSYHDNASKDWNWNKYASITKRIKGLSVIGMEVNGVQTGMMLLADNFKTFSNEKNLSLKEVKESVKNSNVVWRTSVLAALKGFQQIQRLKSPNPSTFLWLLQGSDKKYLKDNQLDKDKFDISIGSAFVHYAITHSENSGYNGRIVLHADDSVKKENGERDVLQKYYGDSLGMAIVGEELIGRLENIKISPLRKNDGRYYEVNEKNKNSVLKNITSPVQEKREQSITKSNTIKVGIKNV